jgi:hypothetical protein
MGFDSVGAGAGAGVAAGVPLVAVCANAISTLSPTAARSATEVRSTRAIGRKDIMPTEIEQRESNNRPAGGSTCIGSDVENQSD